MKICIEFNVIISTSVFSIHKGRIMSVFQIIFTFILVYVQKLEAIECPTKTDNKCEKFWHKLFIYPGHNLREGLKCLNYDGNITAMQALGKNH